MKKRISCCVLLILCLLVTIPVHAASAKINKSSVNIAVGESFQLKINNTNQTVSWSVSKSSVIKISSKGVVKGLKPGTAYAYGDCGGKRFKCKVTVSNADAVATTLTIKESSGGMFIIGSSTANITFKLDKASTNVLVMVKNSNNKIVYKKNVDKCSKNTNYNVVWNGKNSASGKYVPAGKYYACVKAGTILTNSKKKLTIKEKILSGGNGTKANPFLVSSLDDFKKIENYNGYYFKQTKNLSGNMGDFEPLFDNDDEPFVGFYNGNGKQISDFIIRYNNEPDNEVALFANIGEQGVVKNLKLRNINVIANRGAEVYSGIIAADNFGEIINCTVNDCSIASNGGGFVGIGCLCNWNGPAGLIKNCTVQNVKVLGTCEQHNSASIAGLVRNNDGGRISGCTVSGLDLSAQGGYATNAYASALVEENRGNMQNNKATGCTLSASAYWGHQTYGVCRYNNGFILSCIALNCEVEVEGVGENYGTIN